MRNITGQAVVGDDLYGREYELTRLWEHFDQGEHVPMLAPRRVGKTSLMSGTAHLDHYEKRLELGLDEQEYAMARSILGLACRSRDGVRLSDLGRLGRGSEPTFQSVLRDLKADGYVVEGDRRLVFRSNLLRVWWRKHHGRG